MSDFVKNLQQLLDNYFSNKSLVEFQEFIKEDILKNRLFIPDESLSRRKGCTLPSNGQEPKIYSIISDNLKNGYRLYRRMPAMFPNR